MREFIHDKWGDLVGLGILLLGVAIACWGAVSGNAQLAIVGGGMMNAGFIALKLKATAAPPNGNGSAPSAKSVDAEAK